MKIKTLLKLTPLCFGSLLLAGNSVAQTEINRDAWSVSSNRNSGDASFAIDNDNGTRWTTEERQRDGQFFLVDFNESHTINRVVLNTSGSSNDYPRGYELQVSTNGLNFTTIAAGEPSPSGITTINFSDRTVGMVRIMQTGSDNRFWWSIHEIDIFSADGNNNNNSGGSTDFSDSDDWSLSASSNRDLRSALDGNSGTRWATRETQRDGQFYQINFNSSKTFDRILLDTSGNRFDYPRDYTVRVSNNGSNFSTVASGRPGNNAQTLITFPEQTARYVRIDQNGSDNRRWWSIHEMTIASGEIENGNNANNGNNGNQLPAGVHPDIVRIADIAPEEIIRNPGGEAWKDSYSVGDRCYCDTTGDHEVDDLLADTPLGRITTETACAIIGPGPGSQGNPIYNDIQCGNGPANNAGDEDYCPGRVDIGREGCTHIGPRWNFD